MRGGPTSRACFICWLPSLRSVVLGRRLSTLYKLAGIFPNETQAETGSVVQFQFHLGVLLQTKLIVIYQ